jgi:hypothetical protein
MVDVLAGLAVIVAWVLTGVVSYRRNRYLWGKSTTAAALIGVASAYFIPLTWIVWWASRAQVGQQWMQSPYRSTSEALRGESP